MKTDKDGGFAAVLREDLIAVRARILEVMRYQHFSFELFDAFQLRVDLDAVCSKIQECWAYVVC